MLTLSVALTTWVGCDAFYDEGSRFASQVADFAENFRKSPDTMAVFDYVPKYGSSQRVYVEIGHITWCPKPPCENQGAATFQVERGRSGTGYRILAAASVPARLALHKQSGPIHVHMRKVDSVVEIIALD